MNRFTATLAACLLAIAFPGEAAEVRLFTPVTYDKSADVPDQVKEDCRVDSKLQEEIARAMRRYNKVLDMTDTLDGQVLRVTITDLHANPGAAFSGPKSLSARLELIDNGKIVNSTVLHSSAFSTPMLSFKTTCRILDHAVRKVAVGAAKWARNPHAPVLSDIDPDADAPTDDAASGAAH